MAGAEAIGKDRAKTPKMVKAAANVPSAFPGTATSSSSQGGREDDLLPLPRPSSLLFQTYVDVRLKMELLY